jgi:hypothetical protein
MLITQVFIVISEAMEVFHQENKSRFDKALPLRT